MPGEAHPRILIVDDTEAVRYATSRILRRAGFETIEAENGNDALQSVREDRPDLVVLDVNLPDISGFEVSHQIRSDASTSGIPILQISAAYREVSAKVTGLDAGADAYLTHPVSDEELLATVNALLRIRRAEEEARRQATEARAARDELQNALAALREKHHELEALIGASPLAIMAIDLEGRVRTWNPAAQKIFGWTEHEVLGKGLPTFEQESGNNVPEQLAQRGERFSTREVVRRRKDGKHVPVSLSAAPVYDSMGQLQGSMIVATDESAHKIADEALRRHEQLIANGRMASALAHEINNPLSAVLNALYLLRQRTDFDKSAQDYLRIADEQLGRVAEITTQVLGVHRTRVDDRELRIPEIIDAALSLYTLHVRENRIEVKREYGDLKMKVSSPGDFRQIVSNLVGNAIDAVESGGILAIRAREHLSRGQKGVRITVADNGPGIPVESRAHIFEPFFTSKGDRGTGLGLWIVNSIVHKYRGRIRFRTANHGQRRGTSFSVFLPQQMFT